MACARAVTTTLAMLCALTVPEISGQIQLEPSPHRPQLQELQQLTRLLENELQIYDNRQNNPQQPWWAQQQHPYVPLHLQDQPDVVLVPGQQQLAQLEKQLEHNFQGGLSAEQLGQFGQRIKQRPIANFQPQLPPPPPSQPLLYTPQFKPLPEPFRQLPWQPIQQTPNFQQPQSVQQSQNFQQPQNVQQSKNFQQPQSIQQSQNFQQPQIVQQSQNFQQPQSVQQSQNFQQPQIVQQSQNFQQPQSAQQSQTLQQPQRVQQPQNFQQPHIVQQSQAFQQPHSVQQSQNFQQPFIQQQPSTQKQVSPLQQPTRPPTSVPLNLQQQPEVLDLSQLKQLVQLQQDIDQQREKQVRQRQQEQLLQQQQTPVQQQRAPAQQQQRPAKSTTPSPQQRQRDKQRQQQQQQRQTNLIPATNTEKQPKKPSNTTEKPITSVRDLFNTSSCVEPPFTCPHPRIQFYLYTRSTQNNPKILDVLNPNSLRSSDFDPSLPIKVLIHGFQGGRNFSPSTDLRKAYFTRGGYNVFVVEYGSLVRLPCLNQVQWSPSFLAMCISQLVSYVGETSGIPPERFHLIGYSIGAHVAGLVANFVPDRKLGRITGLDPTIIFYQGSNKSHDLDPSDARFVDVIHTGAGILGQRGPNGHVDYYVNGGTTQPGCQSDSLIKTLSCDHTKVSPYYVESIVTPSGFWALPCPNYFMYLIGLCQPEDKDYILMGEDAPLSARGIYYVTTNAFKPYAKGWPGKGTKPKLPGRPF